jgi:hypothetical protein
MPKDHVPAINVREARGESGGPDRLVDDWLGDEAEIDWFSEPVGTPGRQIAGRAGHAAQGGPGSADDLRAPVSEAERAVRRRRFVGLAVLLILAVAAVAALVSVLGGSNPAGSPATTPAATTTAASTTTTKPATTTPQPGVPSAPAPAVVLPAAGTLRAGDSGSAVKKLQRALSKLGFDSGKADGSFGAVTVHAVAAFQEANGLPNDGIVGPATAAKINAAVAGQRTG